jgi:hypothetical protein
MCGDDPSKGFEGGDRKPSAEWADALGRNAALRKVNLMGSQASGIELVFLPIRLEVRREPTSLCRD